MVAWENDGRALPTPPRLRAFGAAPASDPDARGMHLRLLLPDAGRVWNRAQDNIPYKDIRFESADGVPLHGWLLCPRKESPRGTILFLHGNAENISTHVQSVLWIVDAGYEVFAFDYRGYGWSGGKPDIPGVHRDARAAAAKLLSLPGVSAGPVRRVRAVDRRVDRRPHRRDAPPRSAPRR